AVPATLHAVAVGHDARGKPEYRYDERLAAHMRDNALRAHLSISDEDEHIVAFALIESV
ncbi:MAG TPA: holo-ACP synthase, partial [Thauera aminoaromatica]|nr:holo-ACP synthase [Thauera aminoaromatica]